MPMQASWNACWSHRRDTLSFFRSKVLWFVAVFLAFPLFGGSYILKIATSVYKTDLGNGVVIYGDEYVESGRWVFDCKYSRVIGRERLPVPLNEISEVKDFAFGQMLYFNGRYITSAKDAVVAVTSVPDWYKDLQYVYSGVGENSRIGSHKFFLVADYAGHRWAVEVSQSLRSNGNSRFVLTGRLYDPETYVDYTKAFDAAVKSCPAPQ